MSTTSPPVPYPVGYQADFAEQRSRAKTFFRYLLAIPHFILAIVYGVGLYICVIVAWFAIVFTGRYPGGLYNFNSGAVRYFGRLQSYLHLTTDAYPPFDVQEHPEYPVRVPIGPPKESYNRLKTALRILIGIPVMLINYALGVVAYVSALISWFWIVITGKQNEGLHNAIVLGMAYYTRSTAYMCLLTEDWPPFSPDGGSALGPAQEAGALTRSPAAPAAPAPAETPAPDVTQE